VQSGLAASISMKRSEYFAALCILGVVNGIGPKAMQAVAASGLIDAAVGTFDISAVVWVACAIAIGFLIEDQGDRVGAVDIAVGVAFLALVALPIGQAAWLGLWGLGLYIVSIAGEASARRRGATILIAITVPMLWSRLLFRLFSDFILHLDASLVGYMLGTETAGNVVQFADGSGNALVILSGCSSLAGLSLVPLCWVTLSQLVQHNWSARDTLWCILAAISVVSVNVARVSMMGLSEAHYVMIHSPWGNFVASTVTLSLVVGFCSIGVRRELFADV
jgi:hypothetical protein